MIATYQNGKAALHDVLSRYHALLKSTEGATAIEYGLIAAIVVVVVITALSQVRAGLLNLPFPTLIAAFVEAVS